MIIKNGEIWITKQTMHTKNHAGRKFKKSKPHSKHNFFNPRKIHDSPTEPSGNGRKSTFFHLRTKHIMLVGKPFVVPPDLTYHSMRHGAIRAFSIMVTKASEIIGISEDVSIGINGYQPLMIAVIAHKVYTWEVKLAFTCRTLGNVEDPWMVGVGQFLDLS